MPKFPTTSRNPTVSAPPTRGAVRRSAGSGPPPGHALRSLPPGGNHAPQHTSPRMQVRSTAHITPTSRKSDEDPDFETAHAACTRTFRLAEEHNQKLKARFTEQQQQSVAKETQLNGIVRQLRLEKQRATDELRQFRLEKQRVTDELQRLRDENTSLQQRLDATDLDRSIMTLDEHSQVLREIHAASSLVTDKVLQKISETQNVQCNASLPFPEMTQGSWVGPDEHFDLPSNPPSPGGRRSSRYG
ncbi:uncharacterized protein N7484_008186 [Penicillium longicatenatum]|uniref:uncharacterized protein n=1 Tax=Penicillium longicatenatum TaxID=1561947 RepID=UPI0025494C35|nr:uncharacterized protein N7484_008186 [Penicillium longicatenatum]KAJ5640324.1 hypothetical protein N7484_008186 [Penicillium longicatenatum]